MYHSRDFVRPYIKLSLKEDLHTCVFHVNAELNTTPYSAVFPDALRTGTWAWPKGQLPELTKEVGYKLQVIHGVLWVCVDRYSVTITKGEAFSWDEIVPDVVGILITRAYKPFMASMICANGLRAEFDSNLYASAVAPTTDSLDPERTMIPINLEDINRPRLLAITHHLRQLSPTYGIVVDQRPLEAKLIAA